MTIEVSLEIYEQIAKYRIDMSGYKVNHNLWTCPGCNKTVDRCKVEHICIEDHECPRGFVCQEIEK